MRMKILQTERTIIEKIGLDDAEFFVALVNTPDWLNYIGDRNVKTVEDSKQFLRNGFLRSYEQNRFGYYIVKTLDRVPIGICGFLKKPHLKNVDFGFAFLPKYCGIGYGFESAMAILEYGVKTFLFSELDAITSADNSRSQRLLNKLNFVLHNADFDVGDTVPVHLYRWQKTKNYPASVSARKE